MKNLEEQQSKPKETINKSQGVSTPSPKYINPTNLIQNPSSPWTALREPIKDPKKMKFFGFRFISVWVLPMAALGILMEFLFISQIQDSIPFGSFY